ncbi:sulfite exporter TauE/SafE family protein [Streptosporangium saharense]|uniref:sulfite exporter TauE/SafE family protein n=1 Tax=Streptosporangium saharense TaxID=1706840 RepID=UPI0033259A12
MTVALVLAGAVVVGVSLGLFGAGGSVLALPVLVYGAGQSVAVAVPTSLVVVAASSVGALVPRLRGRQVRWGVAVVFAAGGVPAALAGAVLGRGLPDELLLPAFAVIMVVVAVRMLRGGESTGGACRTSGGRVNRRRCLPRTLAAGAGVGALTGVFGVGGGFAVVPALTLLLGLTATEAVATSLVVIAVNAVAGFAGHAGAPVDHALVLVFAGGALLTSLVAGRLAARLPAERVRRWFAWTVLALAPLVAVGAWT